MSKIQILDFGGAAAPERPLARLHLADGGLIQVDGFHFDATGISAHSAALGDFHLPAGALSELALHPPPLQLPPSSTQLEPIP